MISVTSSGVSDPVTLGSGTTEAKLGTTIGTGSTPGIKFGTDTNFYRSSGGSLKTDGSLLAVGDVYSGQGNGWQVRLTSVTGARPAITFTTSGTKAIIAGTGTPEANVTADVGSLFMRTDGGAATTLYVKETGVGNTGWVAK